MRLAEPDVPAWPPGHFRRYQAPALVLVLDVTFIDIADVHYPQPPRRTRGDRGAGGALAVDVDELIFRQLREDARCLLAYWGGLDGPEARGPRAARLSDIGPGTAGYRDRVQIGGALATANHVSGTTEAAVFQNVPYNLASRAQRCPG